MVRSNQVERIFKFSNGANQRTFLIRGNGGIDAVNASRVFPEITLTENRLVVYEDFIIYQEAPAPDIILPAMLDFDLNLIVVGLDSDNIRELLPFAVGTVELIPPPGKLTFYLYPTYDVLQRYRQGNICRIHPAVRAIYIYCTGSLQSCTAGCFNTRQYMYRSLRDTNQLTHHCLGCMEY